MVLMVPAASSGQGGVGDDDERKRKRMMANRESARRSRMRKQQRVDDLVALNNQLLTENKFIQHNLNAVWNEYIGLQSQNNVLRAQIAELKDRLESLNSVFEIAEEVCGPAIDIPEIPDVLLEPWQLPYPVQQPVGASSDMLQL